MKLLLLENYFIFSCRKLIYMTDSKVDFLFILCINATPGPEFSVMTQDAY